MQVHRHAETAALGGYVAEKIILQLLVRAFALISALCVGQVHLVETKRTQVGHFELLRHCAAFPVTFQRGSYNASQIVFEVRGRGLQSVLTQIAAKQFVFQRKEKLAIRIRGSQSRVIEREQQRVRVGHPSEPGRLNTRPHLHAVRQHYLHAHLIQHPGRIGLAL